MNRSWIVSVGPNEGRGSSHAHGPVTDTGPVRVIEVDLVEAVVEVWRARKATGRETELSTELGSRLNALEAGFHD